MSHPDEYTGVNGEALQVHTVDIFTKSFVRIHIRYYKSCYSYQVLQVTHATPECAILVYIIITVTTNLVLQLLKVIKTG